MQSMRQVPLRVASVEELLAVARAMERESAARYRALAADMRRLGDGALAAQFEALARLEDRHADDVASRGQTLLGRVADDAAAVRRSPSPDGPTDSTPLTIYQALALAVRNEERAFAFYTYLAAETEQAEVRALAEALARDELAHATLLRHHRRRAFHAQRPATFDLPETVDALRVLARRWDAEAAGAHLDLASRLDTAGEAADAAVFRRLAAQEAEAAEGSAAGPVPPLHNPADGLRWLEAAFDRYALISERSKDEDVVAEAQRLAGAMVARLALAGGARRDAAAIGSS
jgi:rubrerythrin